MAGGAAWARLRAPPPAFAAALAAALLLSCISPHVFLAATDLAGAHACGEQARRGRLARPEGLCGRPALMRPERLGPRLAGAWGSLEHDLVLRRGLRRASWRRSEGLNHRVSHAGRSPSLDEFLRLCVQTQGTQATVMSAPSGPGSRTGPGLRGAFGGGGRPVEGRGAGAGGGRAAGPGRGSVGRGGGRGRGGRGSYESVLG